MESETDILIPLPYHRFETQLNKEARLLRSKVIKANKTHKKSFESLPQNMNMVEVDLSLSCAYLKTKLITPVRTVNCQHIEAVDLTALVYSHKVEGGEARCPTCKKAINDWENEVVIDSTIERILHEVREDCDRVRYILAKKKYYVVEGKLDTGESEMFTKIQEANASKDVKLQNILNAMAAKGQEFYDNPMIPLTCALSSKRMNYPCRFKGCTHIECFDLEELIFYNKTKLLWKCTICGVETKTPRTDIEIDKSLEAICLKHDKTVLEVCYAKKRGTFFVHDDNNDPFLKDLKGDEQNSLEQKTKFVEDNFKMIIDCCAQTPRNSKDNLLTQVQRSKGNPEEIEINLLDKLAHLLINFPARTENCTHIEACDVKTYLVLLANGEPRCPHCNEEFSDPQEIYIDNFLLKALMCYAPIVTYRFSNDTFLPKNEKLQAHLLINTISDNNKNSKVTYESERYKKKELLRFNLICLISQKLMKIPITLKNCIHPACFDQEAYANNRQRPSRCPFPGCGEEMVESNLVQDMVVTEILAKNSSTPSLTYSLKEKNIILENNQSVIFDVKEDQLTMYQNVDKFQKKREEQRRIEYQKTIWTPPTNNNGLSNFGGNNTKQQKNFDQNPTHRISVTESGGMKLVMPSAILTNNRSGEERNPIQSLGSPSQNPSTAMRSPNRKPSISVVKIEDTDTSNLSKILSKPNPAISLKKIEDVDTSNLNTFGVKSSSSSSVKILKVEIPKKE